MALLRYGIKEESKNDKKSKNNQRKINDKSKMNKRRTKEESNKNSKIRPISNVSGATRATLIVARAHILS